MTATAKPQSLYSKFASKFGFADEEKLIKVLKATAFKVKEGEVTDEQLHALLVVADEYGLNPFTREIFAYPDKQNGIVPVVSVDGWSRIINQHPDFDGLEFVYSDQWITDQTDAKPCPTFIECIIYRKTRSHSIRIREYLDEVFRKPFNGKSKDGGTYQIDGPWQTHTKRLLRHKSLIQCARIAFGFVGIYDEDEAQRILEGQAAVQEAQTEPSPQAVKALPRLIARAEKENSWQACLEYIKANYVGIDLDYLTREINGAKEKAGKTLPEPSSTPPPAAEKPKTPLADAKAALAE